MWRFETNLYYFLLTLYYSLLNAFLVSGTADLAVRKVLLRLSRLQAASSTATRPLCCACLCCSVPLSTRGLKEQTRVLTDILEVRVLQSHEETGWLHALAAASCGLWATVSAYNGAQVFWREVNKENRLVITYSLGPVTGKLMGAAPGRLAAIITA